MNKLAWNTRITVGGVEIDVTPAAGWLVDFAGMWGLIWKHSGKGTTFNGVSIQDAGIILPTDTKTSALAKLTPLAPPPSREYTRWDALQALPGFVLEDEDDGGYIPVELGYIWCFPRGKPQLLIDTMQTNDEGEAVLNDEQVDAHMRDMKKFGVLLDYCKRWDVK